MIVCGRQKIIIAFSAALSFAGVHPLQAQTQRAFYEKDGWTGFVLSAEQGSIGCAARTTLDEVGLFTSSATQLSFALAQLRDFKWAAVFAKPGGFHRYMRREMELLVDGKPVHRGTAVVDRTGLAILQPPLTDRTIATIGGGTQLQVVTVRGRFSYGLNGSADAIDAVAKCVSVLNEQRAAEIGPGAASPQRCIVADPADTTLNVRQSPNGPVIGRLSNGEPVVLIQQSGDWQEIGDNREGKLRKLGWVWSRHLDCSSQRETRGIATGTGFYVSAEGHILTNAHVVEGCQSVIAQQLGKAGQVVRIIRRDPTNDLALLLATNKSDNVPALKAEVRTGESIAVYGFPMVDVLPSTVTLGNVTANAGVGDDTRMLQLSAPVQVGNSGGPLLDQFGNVVGIVIAKLRSYRGDVPQNINFAVKSAIAISFLEANGVRLEATLANATLSAPELAERAKELPVFIACRRG